ncbi:Leucine-rich repeat and immunoglobulin-like domain-containing nogo receptor-interacting protein 2 [Halotydeus destructor]|nr:Leucine-rich repeat and immunoglobulin-like domain-containing nogo receptor-interacting protein 2 [Halotydeus destructor]
MNGELECYGSQVTDQVLEEVFQRLVKFFATTQEKQLNALKLYKTEITQLEKTTLGEISLACIDINGNQNLSLNSMHRITLVKSKDTLTTFKYTGLVDAYMITKQINDGAVFELVDSFLNLVTFWVTDARLPSIQRSAFGRCELPNVKTVYLPRNNIERVGDYAFYRLPNLTYLNLRDNEISHITNHTFAFEKPSDEVLILDLQGNIIASDNIEFGAFFRLNRPVNLNLYDNLMTYLDEETFRPILSNPKSSITVTNNPIICDCRMKWLLEDAGNFMDRVHGLMCGGKFELWYFTPTKLDFECNETVLTQRYYALNASLLTFCFLNQLIAVPLILIILFQSSAIFASVQW